MNYYELARELHITFGSLALIAFWITAVLRKGTATHRLLGRTYLLAILAVIATALPLALHAFFVGLQVLGIFLLYLVLITSTAVWSAWRAIRRRASYEAYIGGGFRALAWINVVAGFFILAAGVRTSTPLLMGMSAVGLVAGYQMLRFAARAPQSRQWWLKRHYVGIVGSGVATHIAFLNLGLSHLVAPGFAATVMYFSWFGPLLAGVVTIQRLNRRHEPRAATPATSIAS